MSFISVTSCFGGYLVNVVLGLVVLGLERGDVLPLLLEEAEEALFLALVEVEALQLDDEVAELLADLAHVLRAHLAEGGAGEVGDVLLRGGAVVEYLLAVGDVYLLGELRDGGLLGAREALELELLGRDLLLLWRYGLGGGLFNNRGLGGGSVGVEGEGGDELLIFVHDILSFPVYY